MDGCGERLRHRRLRLTLQPARLDPLRPYKPLDVGNGVISGTLTPSGRWLSVGVAHRRHGRIVLTSAPPFDESRRYDQAAVRAYRAALAAPDRASFGLTLADGEADAFLIEDALPLAVSDRAHARVEITTFAPAGARAMVQVVRYAARSPQGADASWTGDMRLARAAYPQITEGGPLPPFFEDPLAGEDVDVRWIEDRALGASVAIAVPGVLDVASGAGSPLVAVIAFADGADEATVSARAVRERAVELLGREVRERRAFWISTSLAGPDADTRAIRRGVSYALDAAACATDGTTAVLADHEILPLVWTRDAYYVCRALLAIVPGDRTEALATSFLHWLYDRAERPGGWWPRASLASGQAKDHAFQLDQQVYPLLLLCDARRLGLERAASVHTEDAERVCDVLLGRRSELGLLPTSETPADDRLEQPYHFSSHVLLWRVLRLMGRESDAAELRDSVREHFTIDGRFAYAVAGPHAAGYRAYHDANDLPTVFAPGWGFCAADDPVWRATVAWAWTSANEGYFHGVLGGLGSLHTPSPWPLGDLQRVIVARLLGDAAAEHAALERLRRVSTWDDLLPEAYDATNGETVSRHWFAWPSALWSLLLADRSFVAP